MKKNVFVFSLASLVCVTGLMLLGSCLKADNNNAQQPASGISVLQASPGLPPMDLYFNKSKIFSQSIPYAVAGSFPYNSGSYVISFVSGITGDTLVQKQDSVGSGQYYSLIVYDTASAIKAMFFADQFDLAQDASKAYIRFLQLSPRTDPVDVHINTTTAYTDRLFADNVSNPTLAKFTTISEDTYSFTALDSNTGDTLDMISNVNLTGGRAYTLFLRGLPSHTDDSLGVQLDIVNNY